MTFSWKKVARLSALSLVASGWMAGSAQAGNLPSWWVHQLNTNPKPVPPTESTPIPPTGGAPPIEPTTVPPGGGEPPPVIPVDPPPTEKPPEPPFVPPPEPPPGGPNPPPVDPPNPPPNETPEPTAAVIAAIGLGVVAARKRLMK